MPKYTAKGFLVHKGELIQTGGEVELTAAQAERLGDQVVLSSKAEAEQIETFESTEDVVVSAPEPDVDEDEEDEDEKALEDMTVKELKAEAKAVGVSGYSNMDREELIEAIEKAE